MKLFKSLLVAPAALGLLGPLGVNASEVKLNDVSNYSSSKTFMMNASTFEDSSSVENSTSVKTLLAGGEGLVSDHDGGFSETTTASFSADFAIGSEDGTNAGDSVMGIYGFQIDLNTSFTGEDSLDISIDAGVGGNGLSELDLNEGGGGDDVLTVDGVAYTFPIGPITAFVGDNMDGSTLFNTACVYGGPSNNLDDCGNGNSAIGGGSGTAAGASVEIFDGFSAAIGYTGSGTTTSGLMTKEGTDAVAGQLSYTGDSFGGSVTVANIENFTSTHGRNFVGLNGYWSPTDTGIVPSISAGYEAGDAQGLAQSEQWFVGLQWDEAGPGTFGAAVGSVGSYRGVHYALKDVYDPELIMYEAFYSYPLNDGMTITPLIYVKESDGATGSKGNDLTGIMVKTSFSF